MRNSSSGRSPAGSSRVPRRSPRVAAGLLALGWAWLWGCTRPAQGSSASDPADPASYSREVREGYDRVRTATDRFHMLDSAVVAGYDSSVTLCYADSTQGAMGYHHMNHAYMDARVDVEHPEILLYERLADGGYRLNGVEYIVPYRLWPRDSTPPVLMGRDMLRSDPLRVWYTHMWVWTRNPSGLFANWNPDVHCPAAG